MVIVNFVILILFSSIMINTTNTICENFQAREFLDGINALPQVPELVLSYLGLLIVTLLILVAVREKYFIHNEILLILIGIIEIFICSSIVFILNMDYKGILLFGISNIIIYIHDNKKKVIFTICALLLYFFMDYNVMNEIQRMCSFRDYMQYYQSSTRLLLNSLRNLLNSLNDVLFIMLIIIIMQQEISKTHKLRELNVDLNKKSEELQLANLQLRDYALRIEKMAETRERNRLAREIHDTLGHVLTSISTGLQACLMLTNKEPAIIKRQIGLLQETAHEGLVDIRRSVKALRPDALERFNLREAIQKLSNNVQYVTNAKVDLKIENFNSFLSADEEEIIYRIVQECLTNSIKHGAANNIQVSLYMIDEFAIIKINDNGMGCKNIIEGFGFRHMRERIEFLGGSIEYQSENGFQIKAAIPIRIKGV